MARAFDRMLFLTATPFQLGHHELLNVLSRFGDVRWNANDLGDLVDFRHRLVELGTRLDESQRTAIALQRSWSRLRLEDCGGDVAGWWRQILTSPRDSLNYHQRAVVDTYDAAKRCREAAQTALQPWLVRHNKGTFWVDTPIRRGNGSKVAPSMVMSRRRAFQYRRSNFCPFSWPPEAPLILAKISSAKRCAHLMRHFGQLGRIATPRRTNRRILRRPPLICPMRLGI